ncbi:MAG: DUF1820 domain-containing protein [endosymbiont of Seepiophila jonesi]|uniref:DUF1820 domain-containing protein n=1 Tax=endosymbiont of Lamellibrachia luymesi TaxID=2200907 RepID=A0A370DZK7_9GAMM|nr:MAG: DUF1820 domain-containing protein [endosymbiont of Lamellibrachia luymesi]RDH94372.1 MAG: DUF1820 domain-containing protein [endosymbiont of Seepiophila jonesi]
MRIFKITFLNQGKVYEVFARKVQQGELYGFVEVEDLIFEQSNSLVIDPSSEKLQEEFAGVNRTLIPIHAVIRIDEVEKEGPGKITELDETSNITPFPTTFFKPGRKRDIRPLSNAFPKEDKPNGLFTRLPGP